MHPRVGPHTWRWAYTVNGTEQTDWAFLVVSAAGYDSAGVRFKWFYRGMSAGPNHYSLPPNWMAIAIHPGP